MNRYTETPRVAMQLSRNVVVASIQVDLDDDVLAVFENDLLGRVHESNSHAVILDVSGLETLDSQEFAGLRRIMSIVSIMGCESILVGLQPGVVSALIEMEADVEGLQTAIDLDAAFELLDSRLELAADERNEIDGEEGGDETSVMPIEAADGSMILKPDRTDTARR